MQQVVLSKTSIERCIKKQTIQNETKLYAPVICIRMSA
jgi:hypothetical protein